MTAHGSFALRGGILDVFPASDVQPVRVEFVGDMVESLRRFDPDSQRSVGPVDVVEIVPAVERFEDDDEAVSFLDFAAASGADVPGVRARRGPGRRGARARAAGLELRRRRGAGPRRRAARPQRRSCRGTTCRRGWRGRRESTRSASRTTRPPRASGTCAASPPPSSTAACTSGWPTSGRARERGDEVLFLAESQGRAERVIEILREYELLGRAGGPHRGRTCRRGARGRRRRVPRLPAGGRGAAGLRRARRLRRGTARRRAALRRRQDVPVGSPRPEGRATWWCTWTTGSASSSASSSWACAAATRRTSSWSSATTTTPSCTCRSSGST